MDSKLEVSLDKLPVKRLDAIEENGAEHFPPDVDYDERRLSLIRRIDFAWAVQKEDKKQKKSSKESSTPWPWQSMVENLQLAHQELSVIIDLINTVEANDAVTVAGMTRPKQLPNELLSDLAVSAATKLQCFRHLGKYFKKSAKSLEQQVSREARFYGALIRLQQNWKVKRQRIGASAGNDGFTVDLFDSSFSDPAVLSRPSLSTVRVDHDSAGMLAINLPPNSCRSLHFGFLKTHLGNNSSEPNKIKAKQFSRETVNESSNDDDSVKETHSVLREVHQTIFDEQVFDLVNHEAFNPSVGVNMTDIRENYLELNLGQRTSVFISLGPSSQDDETNVNLSTQNVETSSSPMDSFDGTKLAAEKQDALRKMWGFPSRISCEIYLRQIFHEFLLVRGKDRPPTSTGGRAAGQPAKDGSGLLGHFCLSLAHRIFSKKVLMELEKVVCRVPYLHLITQPTWNSRTSSWTLFMKVPESVRNASSQTRISDIYHMKTIKSQFRTKVVVNDDCINVEGEGAPNAVSLLKGSSEDICPMNRYDCDLADLSMIILQQAASQVIRWLHEEAVMVGIKANRDFLCLTLELEQGEALSLVAHVDPEDSQGCISWWLVMEDDFSDERKLSMDNSDTASEYRKFLGHLSLDILYSTLMDLVSLCSGGSSMAKSTSTTV